MVTLIREVTSTTICTTSIGQIISERALLCSNLFKRLCTLSKPSCTSSKYSRSKRDTAQAIVPYKRAAHRTKRHKPFTWYMPTSSYDRVEMSIMHVLGMPCIQGSMRCFYQTLQGSQVRQNISIQSLTASYHLAVALMKQVVVRPA